MSSILHRQSTLNPAIGCWDLQPATYRLEQLRIRRTHLWRFAASYRTLVGRYIDLILHGAPDSETVQLIKPAL